MAHITLKLLYYRLNESASGLATTLGKVGSSVHQWIQSDDAALNAFLLGWILFAISVTACINVYFTARKWRHKFALLYNGNGLHSSHRSTVQNLHSEQWLNSLINWLYMHYHKTPQLVVDGLRCISEESAKVGDGLVIVLYRALSGSLPPEILSVESESISAENLVVKLTVQFRHLDLAVRVTESDALARDGVLTVQQLEGKAVIQLNCSGDEVEACLRFEGLPTMRFEIKYEDQGSQACPAAAATGAFAYESLNAHLCHVLSTVNLVIRPFCMLASQASSGQHVQSDVSEAMSVVHAPLKPPRGLERSATGGDKLLVKLRNATSLVVPPVTGGACPSWYCAVELDYPAQIHATNAVQSVCNPSWDEQFILEVAPGSRRLTFSLYDKNSSSDAAVGRACLSLEDVCFATSDSAGSHQWVLPLESACGRSVGTASDVDVGQLFIEITFVDTSSEVGEMSHGCFEPVVSCSPVVVPLQSSLPTHQAQRSSLQQKPHVTDDMHSIQDEGQAEVISGLTEDAARVQKIRSDTEALLRRISVADAEVIVVSPEMVIAVAKEKLAEQSRLPIVPGSRTTTIIVTSINKASSNGVASVPADGRHSGDSDACSLSSSSTLASSDHGDEDESMDRETHDTNQRPNLIEKPKFKSNDRNGQSYSLQTPKSSDAGILKSSGDVTKNRDDPKSISASASDVRPKHKFVNSLRKLVSFKRKKGSTADDSSSSPSLKNGRHNTGH